MVQHYKVLNKNADKCLGRVRAREKYFIVLGKVNYLLLLFSPSLSSVFLTTLSSISSIMFQKASISSTSFSGTGNRLLKPNGSYNNLTTFCWLTWVSNIKQQNIAKHCLEFMATECNKLILNVFLQIWVQFNYFRIKINNHHYFLNCHQPFDFLLNNSKSNNFWNKAIYINSFINIEFECTRTASSMFLPGLCSSFCTALSFFANTSATLSTSFSDLEMCTWKRRHEKHILSRETTF